MYNLDLTICNLHYKFYMHSSHFFGLYLTGRYIKYIKRYWIDKKTIYLICIHKLYTYIAFNLIGSRAYTNTYMFDL